MMAICPDQPSIQDLSACPLCARSFQRLGNHLPRCSERADRDYSMYLSKKTIEKKAKKGGSRQRFFLDTYTPSHHNDYCIATLVSTRNSGASYLNRVELQTGCLALGHANLFIPSTLGGSCLDSKTGKIYQHTPTVRGDRGHALNFRIPWIAFGTHQIRGTMSAPSIFDTCSPCSGSCYTRCSLAKERETLTL